MIKKVCFLNSNFDKNTLSRCVFKIKNLQEKSVTITRESKYETTIEVRNLSQSRNTAMQECTAVTNSLF